MLGQLPRLCCSVITVFPNFGGRFSLSQAQCRSIMELCTEKVGDMKPIFPSPAGGMTFEKVPLMKEFYGNDVCLLMGGGLFTVTPDLIGNCEKFIEMLSK